MKNRDSFFHLHMISDSTGETLITVAQAVTVQYVTARAMEHVYSMVRSTKQVDAALAEIEKAPGIVLYTIVDRDLADRLEKGCTDIGVPCVSVLDPILTVFQSYLGAATARRVGAQHTLDADYFRRIDALNFTLDHDDGQHPEDIERADIVLVGVSRTSKTPTSIYLANRGVKTANVPLVPGVPPPQQLEQVTRPLVVALVASPERVVQLRENRILALAGALSDIEYLDREKVAAEIAFTRKLAARRGWAIIDVSRRSIEETAAAILALRQSRDVAVPPGAPAA
mgnify:CR=1 FL=1